MGCDKSISLFEVAQLMERAYQGLKMINTNTMAADEVTFLKGKEYWIDGTSLIAFLAPMSNMVEPFLRSARTGNNLLLIDQTIAGVSGAGSPESFLTQTHAQVMFMMIIARPVNPGILSCTVVPRVPEAGRMSLTVRLIKLLSMQPWRASTLRLPGSLQLKPEGDTGLTERDSSSGFRVRIEPQLVAQIGVHILRHAMGAVGSLNFFSVEKFFEDCERERNYWKIFETCARNISVIPLYLPADSHALEGIREIAEKGNPKIAEHTLKNVDSFRQWEKIINDAAEKKQYCPQLNDTVIEAISGGERAH